MTLNSTCSFLPCRTSVRGQGLHRAVQLQRAVGAPLVGPEERLQPSLPAGLQLQGEWKAPSSARQEQARRGKRWREKGQEKKMQWITAPLIHVCDFKPDLTHWCSSSTSCSEMSARKNRPGATAHSYREFTADRYCGRKGFTTSS